MARVELIDVGIRIADGDSIDWSSRDLAPQDPAALAILQQLQILERIAAIHASSLPPALPEGFASLDLNGTTDPTDNAAPLRWGRLDIVRKVGRGTFGDVYLAHDRSLDRPVALKLLRHRERGRDRAATDVIEEGRLLARVRHPNIVAVYGAERIDERVGVWTEFVEGATLADEIRSRGPLPPEQVASVGQDVSRALDVVHNAGLLHRDIKAHNVMRDASGRVLLTDFGASRLVEEGKPSPAELAGTPVYLAPEVLAGGPATRASDIYSLGVLLHHLASGTYPVQGRSIRDLRDAHELRHRTPLAAAKPGLPRHLVLAIDRATDPDPARRFSSAGALADALRPTSTVTTPVASTRAVTLPAVLIVALIVVVAGLGALIRFGRLASDPAAGALGVSTQQFWPAWQATAIPSAISPDGTWVLCTIRPGGQLARCPIEGSAPSAVGPIRARPYPLLSPDGRRVAYIRFRPDEPFRLQDTGEVHVAFLDGSNDQVAMARSPGEGRLSLHGWSGDGTTIAVLFQPGAVAGQVSAPAPAEVTLLSATTLKPTATGQLPLGASFARLSRDGRSLVFMRPAPEGAGDIWSMEVGSGEPKSLVTGAARDTRPFWSATGASVLFTSDRGGTYGLWRVALEQGRAGSPELVRDLGRAIAWPYGFTRTGRLFLGLESIGFDSHVAEIDPASATVISPPVRIARDPLDANATPDWSPDGRLLAFVSARGQQSIVTVQSVSGQVQIQFPINPQYFQTRFQWLPDGQSALIGLNAPLQRYDLATGQLLGTMAPDRQPTNGIDVDALSGRMVYRSTGEILLRDLATGVERVRLPTSAEQRVVHFSVSPDGQQLAVSRVHSDRSFSLELADPAGTSLRTIHTWPHEIVLGPWTRDGRYLLFSRILDTTTAQSEIVVLEIATGVARPLAIAMKQIWQMRLHPDGRRLAFVTGSPGQEMALMSGAALR